MSRSFRSFIAVAIPEDIRNRIAEFQEGLKAAGADIRWVRPESLHVTLKFLGQVEEGSLDPVFGVMRETLGDLRRFHIGIRGTGMFPNARRPRILWVGVKAGGDVLADTASRLDHALSNLGFDREKRPFSAHLTIGRVRSPKNLKPIIEAMDSADFEGGVFEVEEVLLMQSDLQPTGAVYSALGRTKLRG